ncbi:unnamed protein product, partial [marine sediment metagenome]
MTPGQLPVYHKGEWRNAEEFITPLDTEVQKVLSETGYDLTRCLDFVCKNIRYELHFRDFFRFPCETLRAKAGDCRDSTLVFVSLAQNFDPDVWAVLGTYWIFPHAWGVKGNVIYETNYTSAQPAPDPENYWPFCMFTDQEVIELWPDALSA